ncbi:hypothetical protein [Flavobacterium macrobrachii]|nr:hypothetical protein [Flavobacterium macrobrachii]
MKKFILIVLLFGFLTSCGPKRMGCGPRSCSIEKATEQKNIC